MTLPRGGDLRRLVVRSSWNICCVACALSFLVVFICLEYLEDHRESPNHDTQVDKSEDVEDSQDFFKERGDVRDILKENRELRRIVKQFVELGSKNTGVLPAGGLGDQRGGIGSWQERSLKYVVGDAREMVSGMRRAEQASIMNCRDVGQVRILKEIGRGYTKITELGVYNGVEVAVKSAGLDSVDVQRCVQEKRSRIAKDCLVFSRYKVMKELLLYQQLRHPNVVRLLGYCLQNDQDTRDIRSRGLTVVTELGTPVDLMEVIQMAWHQRFRIAVGLARLMHFFSRSPLGSLVIRDFQLVQFVLVDDEIKLSDLDDVGNEPKPCHSENECVIGNETHNITLTCFRNQCQGYNEKWNVYNLYRFYLKLFLSPGAPEHVHEDLQRVLVEAAMLSGDSRRLVRGLERVLTKLRTGEGLKTDGNHHTQYKAIPRADYPGYHDYQCSESWSAVNCQFLAFNENQAKQRCDEDPQCKAFVMSYEKTWIGYRSVYLKNDTSKLLFSPQNMVYVKIT